MRILSLGEIFSVVKPLSASTIDRVEVAYWWLMHHHQGQWSESYEDMCRLGKVYTPGAHQNEPHNTIAYDALCDAAPCRHARFDGEL